jgi:hypothetical protein
MCAATRSGGLLAWSKKLGISRLANSDSDKGWAGERIVATRLMQRGYRVDKPQAVKHPYDLLVDGILRVDVKTANLATYRTPGGGRCTGWFYRIGKVPTTDLVALLQKDIGNIYFIPWDACPHGNITITENGKYSEYRNRFGIVRSYVDALKQLRKSA